MTALQAAADEIGITKMLSAREYMQWRGTHFEDKVGRRVLPAPPEWEIISDRFGAWPRALSAAGLISQQEAADYSRGEGEPVSDAHVARWLCVAATELGPSMTIDAYRQWREKQIDDPKAGYPPGQREVQERFGSWDAAMQIIDAALKVSDSFEHLTVALRATSTAA